MPTGLDIAKKKYKSGTLSEERGNELKDLAKKNIAASGGDRAAGLKMTKESLSKEITPGGTSGIKASSGISSPVSADSLVGAKGYEKGQVGIPGVNLIKKPSVLGDVKKDEPTDQIDITKDTGIKTDKITSGTEGSGTIGMGKDTGLTDVDQDGMINESELTGDYKTFYDGLTDVEKRLFLAKGQNAMKDNLDVAEGFANFMRDYETVKSRGEADEDYRLKQEGISKEMAAIQENQTIRKARANIDKLKQSMSYLGDLGMPGVSAQRLIGMENKVTEAERSFRELESLYRLSKSAKAEGYKQKALEYERQMEDISTKLDDNIDKSIQDAYNSMTEADNNGKLDTVEELTAFRDKLYKDLDASITGFTDASIEQMTFLVNRVDNARKEAVTYENNKNSINEEMSGVKGYYVNGNGDPVYDSNGGRIKLPANIPEGFEPFVNNGKFFSPKMDASGELVLDDNGSPIFNSVQLEDEVSVTSQLASAYVDMVNKGVMTAEDAIKAVPSLASNESFIKGLEKSEAFNSDRYKVVAGKGMFDTETGKYVDDIGETEDNVSKEESTLGDYELDDGTTITATKGLVEGLNKIMATNPDIQFDINNLYRTQEDQYRIYGQGRTAEELKAVGVDEEYAQPDKDIVSWSLTSTHMTGNAVDVVLPEGEDKIEYYKGIDEEMKKQGFERPEETKARGDYGHYEYKGVNKGIMGALGVPISYERQIKQMVPSTLMNSEIELKSLNDVITRMGKANLPVEEAALTYLGFNTNGLNKEEAMKYVDVGYSLGEDLPDRFFAIVSNKMNNGDFEGADKYVSNIVEDKVKKRYGEDAIMTATMNQTKRDTTTLNRLIANNPDKIGQFDGRVNDFLRKFKDYPEMTELNTLLTMTQAQTRKHFAGSAVTPSEMEALQDFIGGNTKMTPNNLLTMLNTIKDRTESQYLLQRKQFGFKPRLKDSETGNFLNNTDNNVNDNDPLGLGLGGGEADNDPLGLFK